MICEAKPSPMLRCLKPWFQEKLEGLVSQTLILAGELPKAEVIRRGLATSIVNTDGCLPIFAHAVACFGDRRLLVGVVV
ncbi:hypothetical protein ACRQ5Q_08690 [Bradyrhizobium sp. PMVTL-01]|uniref:hypothetical protein n=1 Tax=Bradyrhizobium sp. PMVTL-01 TaxID=3434999 RepID=UPI003F70BE8C